MRSSRLLTVAMALAAVAGLVGAHLRWGTAWSPNVAMLVVAAVLGESVRLPRAHGRAVSMTLAVVGAAALMGSSPAELTVLALCGWVAQTALTLREGRRPRAADVAVRIAGAVLLGVATQLVANAVRPTTALPHPAEILVLVTALLVVVPVSDELELRVLAGVQRIRPLLVVLREGVPVGFVMSTVAVLAAIVVTELSWLTLPLLGLPFMAAKAGLDQFAVMRRSTAQTLRAMSRLPEQIGALEQGHGVRTSHRARDLARDLGMLVDQVDLVERAALLHGVGFLRLKDHPDLTAEQAALATYEIMSEAGDFRTEAAIVLATHETSMTAELERHTDPDFILEAAGVVRAACRLDHSSPGELMGDRSVPLHIREAVIRMSTRATGTPVLVGAADRR